MDIGKIVKIVTDQPDVIPVQLPQTRPAPAPIPAPDWPVERPEPASVPAEPSAPAKERP